MNFFSSTRTARSYHSFVISALLQLAEIVDCWSDQIFSPDSNILGIYKTFPIYCDEDYRLKYGHPDFHDPSIAAMKLIPEDASKIDYESEFLSLEDKTPEFLTHDEEESSEFMIDPGKMRSFRRNLAPFLWNITGTSEAYDLQDTGRRYLRNGRGEEIDKVKRYTVHRTGVTFRDAPLSLPKKSNAYLRHRKPNRKYDGDEETAVKPYTVADTFKSFFDIPHDASARNDLYRAVWSEDNCKSVRRIVGGHAVKSPEELPYIVFVDTGCGGAIISDAYVLTAAHCVDEAKPKYVYVGSIELFGGCQYTIIEVYAHPRFTREKLQYDIGLLKTTPSFVFSPAVKPIRLSQSKVRRKTCGLVAGWGADSYNGSPSSQLIMTMIPVVGRRRCRMFGIKRGQFCAGFQDATSDACQGDSGGPFVVNGVLVGVVSFGYKCATPNTPGVYVDISYHQKWIQSIVEI